MDPILIVPVIIGVLGLILFLPIKGATYFHLSRPVKRVHEADAVLSRSLLIPGSEAYESYYKQHPEFRSTDDRSRRAPGLLDARSRYYQAGTFKAAKANFEIINYLGGISRGAISEGEALSEQPSREALKNDPFKTSRFILHWLRKTGAHSVGFTRLQEYHLYSHKGRGKQAGSPILKEHEHAIAICVEMDHRMMQSSPRGTAVMESSEQYLQSGVLALKLAAWIRELGYKATAHIDGNYEVICPLVAVDAGLGTIGRMGLLMTPRLGPRVRISVVSTNMPLCYEIKSPDRTILHFCHHCKKCALVCPSAAIPDGPREMIDGAERWQINSEKCYQYWTTSGTDCGRCIAACPFSHPDKLFHRFIRWGIKNNLFFRYLAIKLDDLFYGRLPAIQPLPEWADIGDKQ
ncbi:MAG: 4Fe-4S dicluster domain-containing protein [Bacteroidales bacterium]|nr:4Fe-4S dicluster domain-containing protein [Bacteroidales bacterium]